MEVKTKSSPTWERKETQIWLLSIGGQPHRQGFLHLAWAIDLVAILPDTHRGLTKQVYGAIAAAEHCTVAAVDSAIRRQIQCIWDTNREALEDLLCIQLQKPPTPGQVIYRAALQII